MPECFASAGRGHRFQSNHPRNTNNRFPPAGDEGNRKGRGQTLRSEEGARNIGSNSVIGKMRDICAQDLLGEFILKPKQSLIIFFKSSSLEQAMGQCTSHARDSKEERQSPHSKGSYHIDDFKLIKLIGKGGFSRVWQVQEKKTGKIYALKVMSKAKIIAKKSVKAVLLERMILTRLMEGGNKGTVNMLASFQDDSHLYILMDYLEGNSLRHHLNQGIPLTHQQIRGFVFSLLKALQYLYQLSVVHRDIKPQNILLNEEGHPFLTDFGIASIIEDRISDNNSGTVGYMAPEVMQAQSHTFTADYFAIGVITFQLFFKQRPYDHTNKQEMMRQMVKKPVNRNNFPQLQSIPEEACDFVVRLLERKARERLGHEEGIGELLQHPWFSGVNSDASDRIQLNYIKSAVRAPQNNLSILLEMPSVESADTIMNEEKITKILHRDHVQDMFRNFNSDTKIEDFHRRRMSENTTESTPQSLKRVATTFT